MKDVVATALAAFLLALICAGPGHAGPLEDGEAAYRQGDYATASKLLHPLADQGDAQAQYDLGTLSETGQGGVQDYGAAASWYRKAAEQGLVVAQINLAYLYKNGLGVAKDDIESYKWLGIAVMRSPDADPGARAMAQKNLAILSGEMTQAQIIDAQNRASAWVSTNPNVVQGRGTPAVAGSLPPNERLDALLAAHDWNALGTALRPMANAADLMRAAAWLDRKVQAGDGAFLGFVYARDLWGLGSERNIADPDKDWRVTAGIVTLYTYEVIAIDGARCADRTAPGRRADQLLRSNEPALAYLKAKPAPLKANVVTAAMSLEASTAPLRKDDDFLCSVEGNEVAAAASTDRTPEFAPPEISTPLQEKTRATMKSVLLNLVE